MVTSVSLSPLFDFPVGAFLFAFFAFGVILLVGVVLLEAVVLRLMKWGSKWRSLLDSFLVNLVTTVLGYLLSYYWWDYRPFLQFRNTDFGGFFVMWAMSVVIEGALLLWIRRQPARKTWGASLIMNTASYPALYITFLLIHLGFGMVISAILVIGAIMFVGVVLLEAVVLRLIGPEREQSMDMKKETPRERRTARNWYWWLGLSPLVTASSYAFLLFCNYEYLDELGETVMIPILVLGPALWHLILLFPALNQESEFVRWHGRQALLLAGVLTAVPLVFILCGFDYETLYETLWYGFDYETLESYFIPVLMAVWLFGTLWGQLQAARGVCSLMHWLGRNVG